jgi:hypothetical protein
MFLDPSEIFFDLLTLVRINCKTLSEFNFTYLYLLIQSCEGCHLKSLLFLFFVVFYSIFTINSSTEE